LANIPTKVEYSISSETWSEEAYSYGYSDAA
jgi:hypothetical protein